MAKFDVKIVGPGADSVPTWRWQTEANATAIYAGEPVKLKAAGSPYVIPAADADFTLGTDTPFMGIAASDGTHTASADGYVDVYMPLPGLIYEAKAKTSTTADTLSEINALCGDRVVFDLTSSTYTVDAAAGDGATNALMIVGGNPDNTTIKFVYTGSWFSNDAAGV